MTMLSRRGALGLLGALPGLSLANDSGPEQSLFDGRTLDGWTVREGPESAFYVSEGSIAGSPTAAYPAWLRSDRQYENFDFRCEFSLRGWCDGGLLFHAPEHGPRTSTGFKVSLFHQMDKEPMRNSMGSIYPLVPPRLVNVKSKGEWNPLRIRMDWPALQVWVNGEQIHDLNVENHPDLRYRLRAGYFGIETLTYPLRFRNVYVGELPSKTKWETLYGQPSDLDRWTVTESVERAPARFETFGHILRGDGLGNLATKETYRNFALEMYVRGAFHHNGGLLFRGAPGARRYEVQVHDVEEAHYPTGSLYGFERSRYPRIRTEEWFLFQIWVKDRWCLVRVNGENVMEYDRLENLTAGPIELQAHQAGRWIEYKHVRARRL